MLHKTQLERLSWGRLPRVHPARAIIPIIRAKLLVSRRRGRVPELIHILGYHLRDVDIIETDFSGYKFRYGGAYIVEAGESVKYSATYRSKMRAPITAKVTQILGEERSEILVIFASPYASYTHHVSKAVRGPEVISATAMAYSPTGLIRYDYKTEDYVCGVIKLVKTLDEYPVSGADNAILDLAYDWWVGTGIYPPDPPQGLIFEGLSYEYLSGFIDYEGYKIKAYDMQNIIKVSATVRNNTGRDVYMSHYGLPLSVLYEDNRHVSQVDVSVSFPSRILRHGEGYTYSFNIALPDWCYGRICIAHALRFEQNKMPIYYGGPIYNLEAGEIMLP